MTGYNQELLDGAVETFVKIEEATGDELAAFVASYIHVNPSKTAFSYVELWTAWEDFQNFKKSYPP